MRFEIAFPTPGISKKHANDPRFGIPDEIELPGFPRVGDCISMGRSFKVMRVTEVMWRDGGFSAGIELLPEWQKDNEPYAGELEYTRG